MFFQRFALMVSIVVFIIFFHLQCEDGKFYWSKFLLAASSKFLKETLLTVVNEEVILFLPQLQCDLVQSFLLKSVVESQELQSDNEADLEMYTILGFHKTHEKVIETGKGLRCGAENCVQVF